MVLSKNISIFLSWFCNLVTWVHVKSKNKYIKKNLVHPVTNFIFHPIPIFILFYFILTLSTKNINFNIINSYKIFLFNIVKFYTLIIF